MPTREFQIDASTDTAIGEDVPGTAGLFVAGDDATVTAVVSDADGVPLDLSASGVALQFVVDEDGTNQITKDTAGGGVTTPRASAGVVEVTLASSDTSTAIDGTHELTLTDDGSGNQVTLARGSFTITASYN